MRQNCKQNVKRNINDILLLQQNRPYVAETVLILDHQTSPILSRVLTVQELLACGVTELASIHKNRKPLPAAVSIYYISSSSLPLLYKDFAQTNMYFSINILLNEDATQQIMKDLGKQEEVINRLASFGELQIPFYYLSQNVAYFNSPVDKKKEKMNNQRNNTQLKKEEAKNIGMMDVQMTNRELLEHHIHVKHQTILSHVIKNEAKYAQKYANNLCCAVAAGYFINPKRTRIKLLFCETNFSKIVCQELKKLLKLYLNEISEQNLYLIDEDKITEQIVIVIADRTFDMLSPLIRSYYYGPLLMDVFNITEKSEQIKIISPKIQPTTIKTDHKVFRTYRNIHLYEALKVINEDVKEYNSKNEVAKFQKSKEQYEKNNKKIKDVLKQLPEYKVTIKNYNTNIDIMGAILAFKKEQNLDDFVELEHLIVSGMNGKKQKEKDKKILNKLWSQISEIVCTQIEKCRILILGACFLDISSEETSKLMKQLRKIPNYGDVAMNLSKLCNRGAHKYSLSPNLHKSKQLYLDRHNCLISMGLQEYLQSGKSKAFKEFIVNQTVQKSENISKISKLNPNKKSNTSFIVSMCGGLGFNEISNIERLIQLYDRASPKQNITVNFIADSIVNPNEYLEELCYI